METEETVSEVEQEVTPFEGASGERDFNKPIPLPKGVRHPWHRQDGESVQAFEAFFTYLIAAQDRSLRQVAEDLGKSLQLIGRWSRQWHWVHRVGCYEEHYMMIQLESVEAQRDIMYAKQARLSEMATDIVESRLRSLLAKMEDGDITEAELKNDSLIRLFSEATKIEKSAIEKRIEGAKELSERRRVIEEEYGEQLAEKIQLILNELGVDPQKSRQVIEKHILSV